MEKTTEIVTTPKRKTKNRNNPESKVEGKYYYHYTPHLPGKPRVTVAAHVNEVKNELYLGIVVTSTQDRFVKKTGRVKAMGKAVSTQRIILKQRDFTHKAVRERLEKIAVRELFDAHKRQELVRKRNEKK